ncbi:MAG: RibD family protein [Candidatus Omnitrophica bacterium]|nr:RibD family protein [Candidatus Omnitrophota bacterium]MCB9747780.1 RibD family protein [Candidatus Omnitrophota bacterium]
MRAKNAVHIPFTVAKSAQTLDGKIAARTGRSKWITSTKARNFARQQRENFDAIMVGVNTVIKDDPRLTSLNKNHKLLKVIVDSSCRISRQAQVFAGIKQGGCLIATTKKASVRKMNLLAREGVEVVQCPQQRDKVNLLWLFQYLYQRGIRKILIEGGAQLIGEALRLNLVEQMHIYIAPKILGDEQALNSVVGLKPLDIQQGILLKKIKVIPIDQDILVIGNVYRDR